MSHSKEDNINGYLDLMESCMEKYKIDLFVFSELFTTPYFCSSISQEPFIWAETIPGFTVELFARKSYELGCAAIIPIFERVGEDEYYNSTVVIDRGSLIKGVISDGSSVHCYSKVHIPKGDGIRLKANEKHYFKEGTGFPIFTIKDIKIGILTCYDRRFPEAARSLALQGAEIIFISSAVPEWYPANDIASSEMYDIEVRARAQENLCFVVGCNKAGQENYNNVLTNYFGKSCVVGPLGRIISQLNNEPGVLVETINLEEISNARRAFSFFEDRVPNLYYKGD